MSNPTVMGDALAIEQLVREEAERQGHKIVPGTLKVFTDTIRRSKGGPEEIVGPKFRYDWER